MLMMVMMAPKDRVVDVVDISGVGDLLKLKTRCRWKLKGEHSRVLSFN